MAAPTAYRRTDDELRKLAEGGLTADEVAQLSDDDIRRIGAIQDQPDPLAGKPTVEQFERAKRVADTPRITTPKRTIPGPAMDEGPTSIKGFLESIGKVASGDRPEAEDNENFATPSWEKHVAQATGQPETISNPMEAMRKKQDALLAGGQPANIFAGPRVATKEQNEAIARIASSAVKEGVDSLTQFVTHPIQQLAERPEEFGLNLLSAGFELAGPIRRGGKIVTEATEAMRLERAAEIGRVRMAQGEAAAKAVAARTVEISGGVAPGSPGFEKAFKQAVDEAQEVLRANEPSMNPEQYKRANRAIDDMVERWKLTKTSESLEEGMAATAGTADELPPMRGVDTEAEADLARRMSEARSKRPPLPRHGEETPEQLAAQAQDAAKAEARARIATASPEEVLATSQVLESKLDEVASLKEANRAAGGDPAVMAQLRAIEAQIEGTQEAIADVRAAVGSEPAAFGTGDVVRNPKSGKTYTVDSVEVRPGGKSIVSVVDDAGNPARFTEDALEVTDEAPHVPPGIKVPRTPEEFAAFAESIPEAAPSPEDLAAMAQNKAIPGHEVVVPPKPPPAKGAKVTTSDGITYEFQAEMKGAKGKPPIRYWKADRAMPDGGGKVGSQVSEDVIRRNGLKVPGEATVEETLESAGKAAATTPEPAGSVSAATETAIGATKLTDVLSAAPLGAIVAAGLAKDDEEDPSPRQGSPLALKSALWAIPGGLFAYGVSRYFKSPEFRVALHRFTSLDKTGPADLERVFETAILPLLPDRPASGMGTGKFLAGVAAGAGAGAFVGSKVGSDEVNVPGALFGAAMGASGAAAAVSMLSRQFRTGVSMRQLYKSWVTEAAGMSESAVEAKHVTRLALEGRVRQIKDVVEELDSFNDSTNGAVQAWMAGNANFLTVPEAARPAAQAARKLFDDLSMDLLKSGLVKDKVLRNTIQTNIGTYVPRLLLRYELDDPRDVVESWLRGQGKGWGHVSSKNYLKAKKDIPPDVLKALGEITDNPGYLLAKRGTITAADIEQARYHRFLLSSPENAIPGQVVRAQRRVDKTQKALIAGGGSVSQPPQVRFYSAEGGTKAAEWQGRTYWKMPDDPRYGLVRGQYVEQAVASDIKSTFETTSGLQKIFDAPVSIFKFYKAVANPASQFRNMVANIIFADVVAGIPPWRMDKWTRGLTDLRSKGKWYQQAAKDGAFGGEFSVAEIGDLLIPEEPGATSMMDYIGKATAKHANKTNEFFMKWHAGSEAWARMTVYRHGVETLGMTGTEAANFARRTIPDYQDVPRWIKTVRKSPFGAPFVSFSYKALPRILESAVAFGDPRKMMRFWKYPLAMAALNEYSAQKNGQLGKGEEKDIFGTLRRMTLRTLSAGNYAPDSYDTYRKYLPNHVGKMQIEIPWRDQYDRPQYLDGTYFLPWGDAGELGKGEIAKGVGAEWFPRQLEPTNPWFQLGVAASTGKDSFTGRDIVPAGAVGIEAMAARAQFLMRAWGPSLLNPAGYSAESMAKAFSGDFEEDPYTKSRTAAVAADVFGARSRPVDPKTAYRFKYYEFKKDFDANMAEIRRLIPELKNKEDLTNEEAKAYLKAHPASKGARAIRRRFELRDRFLAKYGTSREQPPSPEKLVEAIQQQRQKAGAK